MMITRRALVLGCLVAPSLVCLPVQQAWAINGDGVVGDNGAIPWGAAISEPALASRSDIIMFDDFESTGWWQGTGWDCDDWEYPCQFSGGNVARSTAEKAFGTASLKIEVDSGSHVGSVNPRVFLGDLGLDEAYVRYYIWLSPLMTHPNSTIAKDDGKLPGLARRHRRELDKQ